MFLSIKKLSVISLFFISASVMASTTVLFKDVAGTSNYSTRDTLSIGDVTVTAWSDTYNNTNNGDYEIEQADYMKRYGNGWGIINEDENSSSPEHTADNFDYNGQVDSVWTDYDFFLFSFTEAVNISQATYSYAHAGSSNTQVSVAALKDSASLNGSSWSSIKNTQTKTSDWAQLKDGNSNYYTNFHDGVHDNTKTTYAKHWLIGALNSTFGGSSLLDGNDGIKLAGITYSKKPGVTEVAEPSSIAILGMMMLVLFGAGRRKQS